VDFRSDRIGRLSFARPCARPPEVCRRGTPVAPEPDGACPETFTLKDPKRLLPAILFRSLAFALWPSQRGVSSSIALRFGGL
jgi:hypothetical protein